MHPFEKAGLGKAPFRFVSVQDSRAINGHGLTSCDYCGTAIRWQFLIESFDGKGAKVGCDCIARVHDHGLLTLAKTAKRNHLSALRREARETKRSAERAAREEARRVRLEAYRESFRKECASDDVLKFCLEIYDSERKEGESSNTKIVRDIMESGLDWGGVTFNQRKLLERLAEEIRIAEAAEDVPVVDGRVSITGKIVRVWRESSQFAYNKLDAKMIVCVTEAKKGKDILPIGYTLRGTLPASIDDAEAGQIVTFDAAIKRWDKDHKKGFFNRPTKARILP